MKTALFGIILFLLIFTLVFCCAKYAPSFHCEKWKISKEQRISQPVYVGGKYFKFPIGGGRISEVERKSCEKWIRDE